ncbi:MAG: 4Fe-4S binding protein, partial [Dehalococcoidales bacterium]|nr:4Fe-4S binding protein [Dehalococcoidales bacterium]
MTTKLMRKIVTIDEEKCNGCGACVPNCAEGALQIINGKAKLVSEKYCDGLGACLGKCPEGAITVEERSAEEFDEVSVKQHLAPKHEPLPCGCPSATVREFTRQPVSKPRADSAPAESMLTHWPVQLALVPPSAPFLQGADLLLAADCTAFAYPGFHDLLAEHALLIACPKLDDY